MNNNCHENLKERKFRVGSEDTVVNIQGCDAV
jgi:hypothetical protein